MALTARVLTIDRDGKLCRYEPSGLGRGTKPSVSKTKPREASISPKTLGTPGATNMLSWFRTPRPIRVTAIGMLTAGALARDTRIRTTCALRKH